MTKVHRPLKFTAFLAGVTLAGVAAELVEVRVTRPTRGDIVRYVALPGTLRALQQVTLQARVAGFVKSMAVDRGDLVKVGQPLAEIEVPELVAERKKQLVEVRVAESELRRLDSAREKSPDLITPQARDAAAGRWEIARAHLEQTETLLQYASITAPFPGVVTTRFVDPGAFVPAGSGGNASSIVTLADTTTLRAQVGVPETEALLVQIGQPVRISIEGLAGKPLEAVISRHSGALDESSRTLWVEADLANRSGQLRPGMFATLRLGLEKHTGALLIPTDALMVEKNSTSVSIAETGRSRKTPVKIGFQDGAVTEILSGLTESTAVIVPGKSAPADGAAVRIQESK